MSDTHMLLWAADEKTRLPAKANALLNDPSNDVFFSVVSIWETAIKYALNRADFPIHPETLRNGLLTAGYTEIEMTGRHAIAVTNLPPLHRDPFDRLLIAQCVVEGFTLLTADRVLARYPPAVLVV
jgi:PIN domain nuclease of toxin-antitoxin system